MKLRIEKAIYGGNGLARADGKAVFVPWTLPGEEVEAHLRQDKGGYATAELNAVLEPSPARTEPPCPYFGSCGGCQYQHASDVAQVEIKAAILRESLERARIADLPAIEAVTAGPLAYRNRIRLHIQNNPFTLCYKKRDSHVNLPVATCPIAAPILQRAIEVITREGGSLASWATEIEFFTDSAESALLLALWTERPAREAERALEAFWQNIRAVLPEVVGAGVFSTERGRRQTQLLAHNGENSLTYAAGQRSYRVSLGSFFQVNRFLIEQLVALVTAGESGSVAWDLYAGVGLFSLALAESFAQVVAVESGPTAVQDLRHNLRATRHRIASAETLAFLRQAAQRREPAPDLLVVDPPRAGLGREVTALLSRIRPPRITYVSCDPATLSRDLAALLESGYRLSQMRLVDLFPQTYHLESVTRLTLD